jgi:hypothetical protein
MREMRKRSKLLREGGEKGIIASHIERSCDPIPVSSNSTTV